MMRTNRSRRPIHSRRKNKPMLLYAAVGILLIFIAASLVAVLNKNLSPKKVSPDSSKSEQSQASSHDDSSKESSSESSGEASEENSSEGSSSTEAVKPIGPTTDNSYFNDACFIGDSRTEGLMLYSGLDSTFYATKGLNISTVFTKAFVNQSMTVLDAMKTKQFKKIYIMFGINEIGWPYPEVFIQKYEDLINQIKAAQPNAMICVQSILPVTASRSAQGDAFNNKNIIDHNKMIKEMAQRLSVQYLDLTPAVSDEAGALPEDSSSDGIHLSAAYYKKWVEYLKAHPLS